MFTLLKNNTSVVVPVSVKSHTVYVNWTGKDYERGFRITIPLQYYWWVKGLDMRPEVQKYVARKLKLNPAVNICLISPLWVGTLVR